MNENEANNAFSITNVCRVCLNTTKHLSPMTNEHIKSYISLVDEIVYKEYTMNICVACQWMLQRFAKFKRQCWMANYLLKEAAYMDSKSFLSQHNNLTSSHHITQTSPATHNYIPTLDNILHDDTHYSIHTHNSQLNHTCNDTLQYTVFTQTYDKDTDSNQFHNDNALTETTDNLDNKTENDKCTNENDKWTNENDKFTNENDKFTNENDLINDDTFDCNDEDELPLVLMSTSKRRIKKGRKKKSTVQEVGVKGDSDTESKTEAVKSKRIKKVLRDGFSSRMVQETSEYVVIKLSKEQVLQEMRERSVTDAYVSSPFKCVQCVKGFNFRDVLDTHMEKHSAKNGAYKCEMCGQHCRSAVSLRGHVKSHTTRYQCKVCGAVRAARQHLVEHHAAHSGAAPEYECLHCRFTTNKRTVMQRHARSHAPREPHACDTCGKLFKTIDYLRLHAARHDKSPRFKCSHCSDTFVYHSLLRRHVQCVHTSREFYCVECDVHFKCAETLRVHFKRAKRHRDSTALKHACNKCSARFFTAGSLATHLSTTHDACKQHACMHCHRTYSTRDAARAHTWRVHARGDARASCPHCHASFARKSVLKAHLRALGGACARSLHDVHDKLQLQKEEIPQYGDKIEV